MLRRWLYSVDNVVRCRSFRGVLQSVLAMLQGLMRIQKDRATEKPREREQRIPDLRGLRAKWIRVQGFGVHLGL